MNLILTNKNYYVFYTALLFALSGCQSAPKPEAHSPDPVPLLERPPSISTLSRVDLRAPRFIRWNTWRGLPAGTDPAQVYAPKPRTWQQWDKTAAALEMIALTNPTKLQLSLAQLFSLHRELMTGLTPAPGRFRSRESFALCLTGEDALTQAEIDGIDARPLLEWHYTRCEPEIEPEQRASFDFKKYPDRSPRAAELLPRYTRRELAGPFYCGYYVYPAPKRIAKLMSEWLARWNHTITELPRLTTDETISNAARLQKALVEIHPFTDGNGRLARLLMDALLIAKGLHPPVLEDMDRDISASETEWADEVRRGIGKTIELMKNPVPSHGRGE